MTIVCDENMTTHCGFVFARGQTSEDMALKPVLRFDGQWLPWAERDVLVEPKLDRLATQEVLADVRAGSVSGGT